MKAIVHKLILLLLFSSLVLSACGGGAATIEALPDLQADPCGNGICDEGETTNSCPVDCPVEVAPQPTPTEAVDPLGYITFVVNVSDFVNLDDSAETLMKLIDLFNSYDLKAEFFLTGPITHLYIEHHPEVVQALMETGVTISYHVRPPHPAIPGFQGPFQIGAVNLKQEKVAAYESRRLDLKTGDLIGEEPGGYQYLTQVFGEPPTAVNIPDDPIRGFILPHLARLGARMVVLSEEPNTDIGQPMQQQYSMWVRPSDVSIIRWTAPGVDTHKAWWDMLESEYAGSYQPLARLQSEVEGWSGERLPFITITIHDYSFYRLGAAPWSLIYYQDEARTQPKSPTFDLYAPDPSQVRSEENRQAIWEAYAALVEWAALNMEVVTSAELVSMAEGG
jgi:hypothetical protein